MLKRVQIFKITAGLCLLLISVPLFAQTSYFKLLGEGDKNTVKLLWLPQGWPKDVTGFDIERREIKNGKAGDWKKLNETEIMPEMSSAKDLANVEPDAAERQRLHDKVEKGIKSGSYKEVSHQKYLEHLNADKSAVTALYIPIALDYDFALINGFGLVDRNIPPGQEYEYGLFLHKESGMDARPAETYTWKYGTVSALTLKVEAAFKPTAVKNSLEITWKTNSKAYKDLNVNGFNIYRSTGGGKEVKLNDQPVWLNPKEAEASGSFFDNNLAENTAYTYQVVPQTLFGTEGNRTSVLYDPARLPGEVNPPELSSTPSQAGKTGVSLTWKFDAASEKDIKGFVVAWKKNTDSEYVRRSDMLSPQTRTFTDARPLKMREYYFYRISAIRNDGQIIRSNELLVFYNPVLTPPVPKGLSAEFRDIKKIKYIVLSWNKKAAGDTLTEGYHIYASFPPDTELSWKANIPLVKGNTYQYEVFNYEAAKYTFAIKAVNRYGDESDLSNTAEALSPSTEIPIASIWPFSVNKNIITLNWDYPKVADLKGFRIYQDGSLVINENTLDKNTRKWVSPPLEYHKSYTFEMEAVSTSGVVSRRSVPVVITTDNTPKK